MFYSSLILNITFFKKKKRERVNPRERLACEGALIKQVFKLVGYEMDLTG
jgi:hypothetical protein